MLEKTQTEQTELKAKVSEDRKRLSDEVQLANDAKGRRESPHRTADNPLYPDVPGRYLQGYGTEILKDRRL